MSDTPDQDNNNPPPTTGSAADRLRARMVAKGLIKEKPVIAELSSVNSSEVAVAILAKQIGVPLALQLAKAFTTEKDFRQVLTLMNSVTDRLTIWSFRDEVVKSLSALSYEDLRRMNVAASSGKIAITPFNYQNQILNCAFAKFVRRAGMKFQFDAGASLVELDFSSPSALYASCTPFYEAINSVTRDNSYALTEWDDQLVALTTLICFHARIEITPDRITKVTHERRIITPPEIDVSDVLMDMGDQIVSVVLDPQASNNNKPLLKFDHWYRASGDLMSVIYCNLTTQRGHLTGLFTSTIWNEFVNFKEDPDVGFKDQPISEVPADVEKAELEQLLAGKDPHFKRNKMILQDSRTWRSKFKVLDKQTHDLQSTVLPFHMSEGMWGLTHRLFVLRDIVNKFPSAPTTLFLFGNGADRLAKAIRKTPEIAKGFFKYDLVGVPTYSIATGADLAMVEGVQYYKGELLPPGGIWFAMDSVESDDTFLENLRSRFSKVVDLQDNVMVDANRPHSHIVIAHNYCNINTFVKALDLFESLKIGFKLYRHPRLHNDHYYIDCETGAYQPSDYVDAIKARIKIGYQMANNNIQRNLSMMTGYRMLASQPDIEYLAAYSLALAVTHERKTLAKKVSSLMLENTEGLAKHLVNVSGSPTPRDDGKDEEVPDDTDPARKRKTGNV